MAQALVDVIPLVWLGHSFAIGVNVVVVFGRVLVWGVVAVKD